MRLSAYVCLCVCVCVSASLSVSLRVPLCVCLIHQCCTVQVEGSHGATSQYDTMASLLVVDGHELNSTLGCLNIEANLVDQSGKVSEQPPLCVW
eukprot:COSAG03_NODE_4284_length_1608_cov_42.590457_2_plen_94_part_00